MSLAKQIERNVADADDFDNIQGGYFQTTQRQIDLTEKFILPNLEEIVSDAQVLRREIDFSIRKQFKGQKKNKRARTNYPEGYCLEITQEFLRLLTGQLYDRRMTGFHCLRNFVQAGGLVKRVWGIDANKTFQNVIQIGSAVLDVARDTGGKRPLNPDDAVQIYATIEENPTQQIQGFEDLAAIMEKYLGFDVYPNTLLPYFAPLYPIIALDQRGLIQITRLPRESDHIGWKNFSSPYRGRVCGLAWKFITTGSYADKTLPQSLLEKMALANQKSRISQQMPHVFSLGTGINDLEDHFSNQLTVSTEDDIQEVAKRCDAISKMYRLYNLEKIYYTKV